MKFSLYLLGYEDPASAPSDPIERTVWTMSKKATIELNHNWGTESDTEFKGYHNGNSDPLGFGRIGITVDDFFKACKRFEQLGVEFVQKPDDGKTNGIAFIKILMATGLKCLILRQLKMLLLVPLEAFF